MFKLKRSQRMVLLTKELTENPGKNFSLSYFCDKYQTAKSSISEDLSIIREVFLQTGQGKLVTISGASGGVVFYPHIAAPEEEKFLRDLALTLSQGERILPGGYLYMTDIIYSPQIVKKIGQIFAGRFKEAQADFIVTIETKGIPLALAVADSFGLPLVIIRDSSRVTEGSAVNINYLSGSNHIISTMSLAKRTLPENSKVIIIDDFMKAGGTAKGMTDLLAEFKAQILGIGVLIATREPENKLIKDYLALLELEFIDSEEKKIKISHRNP